jgi:hypothetical protein
MSSLSRAPLEGVNPCGWMTVNGVYCRDVLQIQWVGQSGNFIIVSNGKEGPAVVVGRY